MIEGDRKTRIELAKAIDARLDKERDYYFEIAKQITTLDTAALLILLAFQRGFSLTPWWPAAFFVISLICAFLSMVHTGTRGIITNNISWGNFYMTTAVVGFLAGITYTVFAALGIV